MPEDIHIQTNLIFNDLALNYITEGAYEKAIVLINKIILSDQTVNKGLKQPDYRYYVNRGDCYRGLFKYETAIEDYMLALKIEPFNWDIKTKLSLSYYLIALNYFNKDNNYIDAEKCLSRAIFYNPKVAEYYTIRGRVRYYIGNYPGSYSDYKMSLQLNPENPTVIESLKQFNVTEDKEEDEQGKIEDGATRRKKRKEKKDAIHSKSSKSKYRTEGGTNIEPVNVSEKNMIHTLLNPRSAKLLPDVIQQRKSQQLLTESRPQPLAFTQLPLVNPYMKNAIIVREEALVKRAKVKQFFEEKVDLVSKSHLFDMFDMARELAKSASVSKSAPEATVKHSMAGMSAVAMKKLSQERSKEALKHGAALLGDGSQLPRNVKNSSDKHKGRHSPIDKRYTDNVTEAEMSDDIDTDEEDEYKQGQQKHKNGSSGSRIRVDKDMLYARAYKQHQDEENDDDISIASSVSSNNSGMKRMGRGGMNSEGMNNNSTTEHKKYVIVILSCYIVCYVYIIYHII